MILAKMSLLNAKGENCVSLLLYKLTSFLFKALLFLSKRLPHDFFLSFLLSSVCYGFVVLIKLYLSLTLFCASVLIKGTYVHRQFWSNSILKLETSQKGRKYTHKVINFLIHTY